MRHNVSESSQIDWPGAGEQVWMWRGENYGRHWQSVSERSTVCGEFCFRKKERQSSQSAADEAEGRGVAEFTRRLMLVNTNLELCRLLVINSGGISVSYLFYRLTVDDQLLFDFHVMEFACPLLAFCSPSCFFKVPHVLIYPWERIDIFHFSCKWGNSVQVQTGLSDLALQLIWM